MAESRVADLNGKFESGFTAALSYAEDAPTVTLTESANRPPHPYAETQERQAFFLSACAVLGDAGFARAGIALTRAQGRTGLPRQIALTMSREEFAAHLTALGKDEDWRRCMMRIRDNPLLLNLFMQRVLMVPRTANENR